MEYFGPGTEVSRQRVMACDRVRADGLTEVRALATSHGATSEARLRPATSARPSPARCEESGPFLTGPVAVDVTAVVVDVATQLPALFGAHPRVASRVAVLPGAVARRHLLRRRRASRRATLDAPAALTLLRRCGKRGEQNQDSSTQCDQSPHNSLHFMHPSFSGPCAQIRLRL